MKLRRGRGVAARLKQLLAGAVIAFSSISLAAPLDDLVDQLNLVCQVNVPPAILERIGGDSTLRTLCAVRDIVQRASALVEAANQGTETFLNKALDEGFRVLRDTTDLDTDLGVVEDLLQDFRGLLAGGVTYEGFMGLVARQVASDRLAKLAAPSSAEPNSVQWFVEENRRLSPEVAQAEVSSILRTAELQERAAQSVELAQRASQLASDAVQRGDEAALTLNVTNPNPLAPGIADEAAERAQNATSTRAAVQVMLDFQADALRQRALETTSLLTAVKEQNVQQGYTVKQLSLIAQQLYHQELREENEWRAAQRQKISQELIRAGRLGESLATVAGAFRGIARELAGEE